MKQNKNSFSVSFQVRWEKIGKAGWLDWRLITTVVVLILRLVAGLVHK